MLFYATEYTVTDEAISATGKQEVYLADDRLDAVNKCLYTHRLHSGNAFATNVGVIHCPYCKTQFAVTKKVD